MVSSVHDEPREHCGGLGAGRCPGPPSGLQPALQLTDADSAALASATVAFTVGHNAGTDELAVDTDAYGSATLPGAMTTSYDAVAGVLTLSGAASPFEYEAVLRWFELIVAAV